MNLQKSCKGKEIALLLASHRIRICVSIGVPNNPYGGTIEAMKRRRLPARMIIVLLEKKTDVLEKTKSENHSRRKA